MQANEMYVTIVTVFAVCRCEYVSMRLCKYLQKDSYFNRNTFKQKRISISYCSYIIKGFSTQHITG